jgi:hypothetical protein
MVKVNLPMFWPGSNGIKGLDLGNLEKTIIMSGASLLH